MRFIGIVMLTVSVLAAQAGSIYASNGAGNNPAMAGVSKDRFDALDRDANGVISRDEWDGANEEFNRRDTNTDNGLSRYEFYQNLMPDKSLRD